MNLDVDLHLLFAGRHGDLPHLACQCNVRSVRITAHLPASRMLIKPDVDLHLMDLVRHGDPPHLACHARGWNLHHPRWFSRLLDADDTHRPRSSISRVNARA